MMALISTLYRWKTMKPVVTLILKDLGRFLSILCLGPRVFVAHNSSVCCATHGYETQNCAWYCHVSPNDDFTWFPKMGIPKMDGLHGNSSKNGWFMGTTISRNSHIMTHITHVPYLKSDIQCHTVPMAVDSSRSTSQGRTCSTRLTLVETNDRNSSSKHLERRNDG